MKTAHYDPVACYTPLVGVLPTPSLTSDSVAGSGASPDRRGNLSISRPAPEFCMDPEVIARFWSKVDKTETCWLWKATVSAKGYGEFNAACVRFKAHRFSYELCVGLIPDGLQLDHLCRVRNCVNPAHLEPVTSRENTLRGDGITAVAARAKHCPSGHPYSEGNVLRMSTGFRVCAECNRARNRAYRANLRAALDKGGAR